MDKENKFREQILAAALLDALSGEERESLARLSGVQLPATLAEMPNGLFGESPQKTLDRLCGLSLVEEYCDNSEVACS